ncbi:MAG: chitobiase/beta-hexosaminidase C-terminal domain-containing protein [Vicinamibacterales bacterium]
MYTFNYGTLAAPVASPGGGSYTAAQTVTLTAEEGAAIRYTVDGSDVTPSSASYVGPIAVESSTTLKARAYRADWSPSGIMTESYTLTLDTTLPTITAHVSPSPNAAGWHSGPVTISYSCTDDQGIATCPMPVTVDEEGTDLQIIGTAIDTSGNHRTVTTAVSLDRTPPVVTLASPVDGQQTSAVSVSALANVGDALSGFDVATCDGTSATVQNDAVTCVVELDPGRNEFVIHVRDRAGNSASAGGRVFRTAAPTSLAVTPGTRTLVVGQAQAFSAVDAYGVPVTGVVWTSSDEQVAEVSDQVTGRVKALGAGTATITATVAGLTADATVSVFSTGLPMGSARWTLNPPEGFQGLASFYAEGSEPGGPDLFAVARTAATDSPYLVTALNADGQVVWRREAPGQPLFADPFGGLVAVWSDASGATGLARFGGPSTAVPWRYESANVVYPHAQGPDGTIYATEVSPDGRDMAISAIDGQTGVRRFQVAMPKWTQAAYVDGQWITGETSTSPYSIVVGTDGAAYASVQSGTSTSPDPYTGSASTTLQLLRITPEGSATSTTIWATSWSGAIDDCRENASIQTVTPDGEAGVNVQWVQYVCVGPTINDLQPRLMLTRVANGGLSQHALTAPGESMPSLAFVGDNGRAYFYGASAVSPNAVALDLSTGSVSWTTPGDPVSAGFDGTLYTQSAQGFSHVDADGAVLSNVAFDANGKRFWAGDAWVDWTGTSMVVGPVMRESVFSFTLFGQAGNPANQNAPEKPSFLNLVPPVLLRELPESYSSFQFAQEFPFLANFRGNPNHGVPVTLGDTDTLYADRATLNPFLKGLGLNLDVDPIPSRHDAIAFIGHGISMGFEPLSIGLEFSDLDLIKAVGVPPLDLGSQYINPDPGRGVATAWWEQALSVSSRAKVVFIGSCWGGAEFESWWNLGAGRALVIAQQTGELVDMFLAQFAWRHIANSLAHGHTVTEAVDAARAVYTELPFKIIGDGNAQITSR